MESDLKSPVSDFAITQHTLLKDRIVHYSRYEFLKGHNGIRPNCLHGLIGTTGSGKSTLLKCIITEAAAGANVLVWLSEENVVEYQELINKLDKSVLGNIKFVEEKELSSEYKENQDDFLERFDQLAEESKAEIIFIDNITTSAFYNSRFGFYGQQKTSEYLIQFVKRRCSVFYVAHTRSEVTDNYGKVITPEDIRGSKELPLVTEYFYGVQKFTSEDNQYNVLKVSKYRHHEAASGWYALKFEKGAYTGDAKVPFFVINRIFKGRDHFGKKLPKKVEDNKPDINPPKKDNDDLPDAFK